MTQTESPPYEAFASEFHEITSHWMEQSIPVAILGHVRPDGDCIGSQVALARVLRSLGVDAVCFNQDPVPRTLTPFVGDTAFYQPEPSLLANRTAITTDCADFGRVGKTLQEAFSAVRLNIDHHISNPAYARTNIVVPRASATAEILASIFFLLPVKVDPVTAQALFIGIATDTGQFRYPNTTPHTFELARRLCDLGADPAAASFHLYEQESLGRVRLLQHFLASLRMELGNRVCIGTVAVGIYAKTATSREDSEGLVDYARAIEGVDIGVFLEEQDGVIKGSLRCKEERFRVDSVAREISGGGHACAAGFRVESTIAAFYPRLVDMLRDHLAAVDAGSTAS